MNPQFAKTAILQKTDVVTAATGGPQVPPPREKDVPLTYFGERDPPTSVDGITLLIPSRTRRKPVFGAAFRLGHSSPHKLYSVS
jgi:hypothetical protein